MTATATLEIAGGVRIVVPDLLGLLTPYVLVEQQDWFEDEIVFLRRLLQPGQKAIDVGANYGVYTLSIARSVGSGGAVWAFEPTSSTAALLAAGIAANNFTQVVLERSALSSECGTARLALNDNSEFNALVREAQTAVRTETVPVLTLDECLRRYEWRDVAFMKIDAEGEEANILRGGRRFFAELSPLVLYEVKAGPELHLELVREFAALGLDSYRLVPGLDLLVPFATDAEPDGFLFNLFACRKDRAAVLAAQGFLRDSEDLAAARAAGRLNDFLRARGPDYHWQRRLVYMPYGAVLAQGWAQRPGGSERTTVEEALSCYAISQDPALDPTLRFSALESSFRRLQSLCARAPRHLRLASLARVAREYGARTVAVKALVQLFGAISGEQGVDLSEPFLPPGKRFDAVSPGAQIANWARAAILEEFERVSHLSSFYTGPTALPRLEEIASLGFGSPEMARRLLLARKCFARQTPNP